jgi:hypothetical protein
MRTRSPGVGSIRELLSVPLIHFATTCIGARHEQLHFGIINI